MERIIHSMKKSNASGYDNIPMEVYAEHFKANKEKFCRLLNICLENGLFPKCWKKAKVVLIPKLDKNLNIVTSYRPISLLPVLGRIFDKILTRRLDYILEDDNFYSKLQFGFRKNN